MILPLIWPFPADPAAAAQAFRYDLCSPLPRVRPPQFLPEHVIPEIFVMLLQNVTALVFPGIDLGAEQNLTCRTGIDIPVEIYEQRTPWLRAVPTPNSMLVMKVRYTMESYFSFPGL